MSKNKENKLIPKLRFIHFKNNAEWHLTQLSKSLRIPVTYGIVKAGDFLSNGVKMVRGGDIKEGRVNEDLPLVSLEIHNQYKRTILCQGDIVISLVGYPGEAAVIPNTLIGSNISRAVGLIRLNNDINPHFLIQYLNSPNGRKNVLKPSAGSAQTVVNLGEVNKLVVPFTIPEEQKKIASCLSSLDEVITSENQKLELLKNHKKGLLQNLFPQEGETVPKLRFKEFEDSGEWCSDLIKNVFSIFQGFAFSSNDSVTNGIRWLKIADVGIQKMNHLAPSYLPFEFKEKYGNFLVREGDYVIALTRPILNRKLKISKVDKVLNDSLLNQRVGKLVSNHCVDYVYYLLQTSKLISTIEKNIAGSEPPNLSTQQIENIEVFIPPSRKEQQVIADTLSSIDDLINAQKQKLDALQVHKNGLLQGLFPKVNL